LQNAPRDADKLRRLLEIKQRQKEEEADHIEDTQRLVAEIEMLKVVLHFGKQKAAIAVAAEIRLLLRKRQGQPHWMFQQNN
jgi:hypothetical protein